MAIVQPSSSPTPLDLKGVSIQDKYWSSFIGLVRNTVIPYQWEALNDRLPDTEPSHVMKNFRIAAGLEKGEFGGFFFQDTDLYKWLEAVGYSLAAAPDADLERIADEAIDLLVSAQQEDGYLNTYFAVAQPGKRWTNLLDCHEMYSAGHLIEAAVAYYQGTGKTKLPDVAKRSADHIDSLFG
ncbi:MAG: glycoside hydrolase family 127 protein, partial [Cohnella sp.]|nr:glycoside hydrolase family 127 protein [Cohnella sp.]